jgi:hypothetical protein
MEILPNESLSVIRKFKGVSDIALFSDSETRESALLWIEENIERVTESGCWLWKGSLRGSSEYGVVSSGGVRAAAHRVMYELYFGHIPDGLALDHLCRVRCCVNPHHLEPVTFRTNTLRGHGIPAINAAKTHCMRGHPLSGENLFKSVGRRSCKTCKIESTKKWARKKYAPKKPRDLPTGVTKPARSVGFVARIKYKGVVIHLGAYRTPSDAAAAYQEAKQELYGRQE